MMAKKWFRAEFAGKLNSYPVFRKRIARKAGVLKAVV